MSGSISYNFDPEQTVYAIVSCEASSSSAGFSSASGGGTGIGLQITNAQFPGTAPIQEYPATGNIIVREGVVKQILLSVSESTSNVDARMQVDVIGGVVVSTGDQAIVSVDVAGNVVTAVTLVDGGSGYIDGTGFTFTLLTTAGGGGSDAIIGYDVVDGAVANLTVNAVGSGYTDGLGQISSDTPAPTGITLSNNGAGYYPDSADATFEVDIVGGLVVDVRVIDGGAQYADGTGLTFNLVTTAGGGDGNAEITYDVVDGVVTNPSISAAGATYIDGISTSIDAADIPDSLNLFNLVSTAGGGDGNAQIGYTVVGGEITDPFIVAGGATYTDGSSVSIVTADVPKANLNFYDLVYRIRFNDDKQTLNLRTPIGDDGVEEAGDIFATLSAAVTEYQNRLSS